MIFIDSLTVTQAFEAGTLPILGEEHHQIVEVVSGEIKAQFGSGLWSEGSYSTKLRITSDGTTLKVSGNPSRFGREDNLYGYTDVRECIRVYNRVLESLWLPSFTFETVHQTQFHSNTGALVKTHTHDLGCKITRIDLTQNFRVGPENVLPFLRSISGNTIRGQAGFLYANGLTTDWFRGSQRLYVKYYAKAQHYKKMLKNPTKYQLELAEWMEKQGIIRFEVSLKSKKLTELELNEVGSWSTETMKRILESYYTHNTFNTDPFGDIAAQIKKYKPEASDNECERAEQIVAAWMTGYDCRKLPKTTYYRYRAMIKLVGLDIASPCRKDNITTMIRTIDVEPLEIPQFYKHVA